MDSLKISPAQWRNVGFSLLLTLVVAIAYGNSFRGEFVLDDAAYLDVEQDPDLTNLLGRIWAVLSGRVRSVGSLGFTLNYWLIGESPAAFHVGNFLVHLATALLLFDLVRRLLAAPYFQDRYTQVAAPLAFSVAVIWAVHPLATMGVTYLIQRFESQAALFYLLTLYCVTRSCLTNNWRWALAAIFASGLAMGTKETAISAPLIAIAIDRAMFSASWSETLRRRGWAYAGMLLVTAYFGVNLLPAFQTGTTLHASVTGLDQVTRWEYLCTESQVITHYLRLAAFPYPLCFDYQWPIARSFSQYAASGAFVVALLGLTFYSLWRRPPIGVVGLMFFFVLAPSSSFVPIADPAFEYRMYLPLACVVLLAVMAGYELWSRFGSANGWGRYVPIAAVSIITIGFVGMTLQRNRIYRTAETVWRSVVELQPDHIRANHNLAKILKDTGRVDEAIAILENSRQRVLGDPAAAGALDVELAEIAVWQGRLAESQSRFRLAIDGFAEIENPSSEVLRRSAEAHIGLGAVLQQAGDHAAAAEMFVTATELRPGLYPQANGMAGISLREVGDLEVAERQLQQAVSRSGPDQPWPRELAIVQFLQGDLQEAAGAFELWLAEHPDDYEIMLRLAWLRAAAEQDDVRDLTKAKRLIETLLVQLGPQLPLVDLAATVFAAEGNYAEATRLCESAIAQQRAMGVDPAALEARLELFENERPYRSARPGELY
ncbi:tetratricopeptide repeat protein [Blastopirellula retiformator]|uniref:Tetratricopeptide repeat protein n=1 Tax=Blastopirellula retiformator TaxID=2527970 RepID=A0A5C5VNP8_9BACT|nr:tetratricopeptide repeat protein [Blastopirellula retiformator]TWT39727.1 Tetratricopeptide repeat protein [Blastopirellula retiformator]